MNSSETLKAAALRIAKARVELMIDDRFVFWSTGALHLVPTPTPGFGTMGVDGKHLFYDPAVVAGPHWSDSDLICIVAHEAGHCMLAHHARLEWREPRRANVAMDRALNPLLVDAGLTLAAGMLFRPEDRGRSWEAIYEDVTDEEVAQAFGNGPGGCGNAGIVQAGDEGDAAAREASAAEWDVIARSAAYAAQAQGHLPGALTGLLSPSRPPLDPRALLRRYVSMALKNDFSWRRPSRRHIHRGIYAPSLWSEAAGTIVIAIDVSGSVDDAVVSKCLGFADAVLADVRPSETWLLQVDAAVQEATRFGPDDRLPRAVRIVGRGGTNMQPIWQWERDNRVRPAATIVLSDMAMGSSEFGPSRGPGHPVLWLSSTPGAKAPFGTTVDFRVSPP